MKTDAQDNAAARSLIAVILAGVLPLIVTWLLVTHDVIPDNEVLIVGLIGFIFVLVLDLLLIYLLIVRDAREGQHKEAVKLSAIFLGVGLLVAPVAGSFLGLLYWASNKPGGLPIIMICLLTYNALIAAWMRHRRRVSREGPK